MTTIDPSGRYCVYLRRSRADIEAEQRGEGETLARHHAVLKDLASRMGIALAESAVYREIVSGDTIAERPQIVRLLRDVEQNMWDGVFVTDVDRLARGDTMDQGRIAQTFLYSRTLIITPYKTYDPLDPSDSEFFEMKLFFARREYEQIKRRLQGGRVNSVKEGLYVASIPIYGYSRVKLPGRKGYSLKPDPERADIVRMVFAWYLRGIDGREAGAGIIAERLNDMGARTNTGLPFNSSRILSMLKNPTYAGFVQWQRRVQVTRMVDGQRIKRRERSSPLIVKGLHPPLISPDDFAAVQERIASRRSSAPKRSAAANIFAGLVKCGVCGRAMIRQMNAKKPQYDLLKCSTVGCECRGIYISEMERAVLGILKCWEIDFCPDELPARRASGETAAAASLLASHEKELAALKKQLSALRDLLERGIYTAEIYIERQTDIAERMGAIHLQMDAIRASLAPPRDLADLPKVKTLPDVYALAPTPAAKNALLKAIISRIVYRKLEKSPRGSSPLALLTLEVYPALPAVCIHPPIPIRS